MIQADFDTINSAGQQPTETAFHFAVAGRMTCLLPLASRARFGGRAWRDCQIL
jgi:hypothetical protein